MKVGNSLKKRLALLGTTVVALALVAAMSFAWFTSNAGNVTTSVGTAKIEVKGEYQDYGALNKLPGEEVKLLSATVTNNSTRNAVARIQVNQDFTVVDIADSINWQCIDELIYAYSNTIDDGTPEFDQIAPLYDLVHYKTVNRQLADFLKDKCYGKELLGVEADNEVNHVSDQVNVYADDLDKIVIDWDAQIAAIADEYNLVYTKIEGVYYVALTTPQSDDEKTISFDVNVTLPNLDNFFQGKQLSGASLSIDAVQCTKQAVKDYFELDDISTIESAFAGLTDFWTKP